MKLAKGVVFFFLTGLMISCFNPPEFPVKPEIEFESLIFKKVGGFADPDSLILSIRFKDGDGDLGIDPQNANFTSYPFHPINYYLAKDGDTLKISTKKVYEDLPPLINIEAGQSGKLVTVRTRNESAYSFLPSFNPGPFPCQTYHYDRDTIYVREEHKFIFDASYNIIDTLIGNPNIYKILDTVYYDVNPKHYNISVVFETKNADGSYTEYDWRKELCTDFNSRFPVLAETKVPLDGTLRYGMKSTGFVSLFGGKTLRLKVQIKDKALHLSNIIYTNDIQIN